MTDGQTETGGQTDRQTDRQSFMKISKRVSELLSGQDFQYSNFQRVIIPQKM